MEKTRTLNTTVFKTVKTKTAATIIAVIAAVALPQLFHALGAASGLGFGLGEAVLPMHPSIFLLGLLAGPVAGLIAGAVSPLISFSLSGMPDAAMLPFMVIELAVYGLVIGLLKSTKPPVIVKLLLAQISGRAARAIAIVIAFYGLGSTAIPVAVIWNGIVAGLFGLLLQWALIPLIMFWTEKRNKHGDLERAKALLDGGNYACVLINADIIYTSGKKGITFLMDLISAKTDLRGFSAADKVVGKAAAMLFALAGIGEVFSEVISESAIETLSKHGIGYSFKTRTADIINRADNGVCPMERAVKDINEPAAAYDTLKEALAAPRAK
jgi:hypothetical protein